MNRSMITRAIGGLTTLALIAVTLIMSGRPLSAAPTVTTTAIDPFAAGGGLIATNTLPPSRTPLPTATATLTLTPTLVVTAGSTFITTPLPPGSAPIDLGNVTPVSIPYAPVEHFYFGRPISNDSVNYPSYNYTYGGTENNNRPIHHGDDFQNPYGTPVMAVADGVIEYAGDDIHKIFGPQPNFYGNVIVIRHTFTDSNKQPVFSLYGHLSQIIVQTGQTVVGGQLIGLVGSAGVAIGPHLHLEVRVGDPANYNATRNPGLWLIPFPATGAIAGRVTDLYGVPLANLVVRVQNAIFYRETETYGDATTPGDTAYHENFAIGDVPEGVYTVFIRDRTTDALLYRAQAFITPNQVTWLGVLYVQQ